MNNKPKRRIHKDNPYEINFCEKSDKYTVTFKDGLGIEHCVDITPAIYDAFNRFELDDIKQMNEFDRNIEHSELSEFTLYMRSKDKPLDVEDTAIKNINKEGLHIAISRLPSIQRKRIQMYFFNDMTLEEIAKVEGCSHVAVKLSIDIGLKELKKLKKF